MWFRYKTFSTELYVLTLCPLLVVLGISEQLSGRASTGGSLLGLRLLSHPKDARTHSCILLTLCVYCCHAQSSLPWWIISPQQNLSLVLLILVVCFHNEKSNQDTSCSSSFLHEVMLSLALVTRYVCSKKQDILKLMPRVHSCWNG